MNSITITHSKASARLGFLDGLRGIAILLVIGYHYFSRWTPPSHSQNLYPYGDLIANFWPLKYGGYGVQLFFIISGFVIALTLNRCEGGWEFFARRLARLYPAMLVCSLLTFAFLSWQPQASFDTRPTNFISSLSFVSPSMFELIFRMRDLQSMDGVYWSLYIEVQFYFMIAMVYYASKTHFLRNFFLLGNGILLASALLKAFGSTRYLLVDLVLIAPFLPLFMIGIGLYVEHSGKTNIWSRAMLLSALVLAPLWNYLNDRPAEAIACLVMSALFIAAMKSSVLQRMLSVGALTRIGVVSYSLYLIHQYIGVSIIHSIGKWLGASESPLHVSSLGIGVVVAGLMLLIANALYRWVEVPAARLITRALMPTAKRLAPT